MNTIEIIKKAVSLPFRAYKGFILVTFLFFVSEVINETNNLGTINELTPIKLVIGGIISIIVLGISIAIVYHYIFDSFDVREVSIKYTTKVGFRDTLTELYYYLLTFLSTGIICYALGIYRNIDSILNNFEYIDTKLHTLTLPKLINLLSPDTYQHLAFSVMVTLAVFMIMFAIFFSYCSLAKIRLKETESLKESMNFIKLTKIIRKNGIKKYLNFVILTLIVFSVALMLMKTLESYFIVGSLISALAEAFGLFFILDSFSLFYFT
ncbi:DUF4013 domain-containing protein [Methanobrevibacter sp.]|uniref:DUF4013 domain-containing protein n=1 Tax=Methanobrevibacter sp. TaxID=66852 RepID=UPI0025E2E008|nr:DUF4013 domain-containing protein [Methanobrevibacter sp.]MBQ2830974.1 hypothetical protein [Methanobrevibacter sp.]